MMMAATRAQHVLSVERLIPAPANMVVVDVFVDVATTDTWTAAGMRATTANGAVLRYGAENALVDPGLADRFVTCLSRPRARTADNRFLGAQAATGGRYDPSGASPVATATEVNVVWFASPPMNATSPSVDGYIARVVIDVSGVPGIDPARIVVAPGLPPPQSTVLLVSQRAPSGSAVAGTAAATFDVPAITGINWSIYVGASPCNRFVPVADSTTGTCNAIPFGPTTTTTRSTLFAQNNNGSIGGAVYFNVTVANPLYVNGLSLNTATVVGTPMTVQVYRTAVGGTHVGNEANPAAWIPETMGFGSASVVNTPSRITLNSPFLLTPGTYGIAIVAAGFQHNYTNGANVFGDANLSIATGSATNVPFTVPVNSPRTPNIELRYQTAAGSFGNQRYQTIVRRSDLLAAPITGLAFAACGTGRHWNDSLLIRMSHVPAAHSLSTTFASNLPAPVTVLNASDFVWHVTGHEWTEVGLQNAFAYDGSSDVVIDIVARGNFHTAGAAFHSDPSMPRVFAFGWTGTPPATATGSDTTGLKLRLQQGCANASEHGWSCGNLRAAHAGQPVLGQTFSFTFVGAPANAVALLSVGFDTGSPTFPFSLAQFGLRNCHLFHETFVSFAAAANASGSGAQSFRFPVTQEGVGFRFHGQWLAIDPAAPDGVAVSNYVRMLCGNAP